VTWRRPDVQALSLPEVMALIRARCPWAGAHTHSSLLPYLLEESHEAAAALRDLDAACAQDPHGDDCAAARAAAEAELGDVLYQVLFHSALLDDPGHTDDPDAVRSPQGTAVAPVAFDRVQQRLKDKIVRRHPHVFDSTGPVPIAQVERRYEQVKAAERAATTTTDRRAPGSGADGVSTVAQSLASLPQTLPALSRAAAVAGRLERLEVDIDQLRTSAAGPHPEGDSRDETANVDETASVGRQLLDVVLAARSRGIDAEAALRQATAELEAAAVETEARTESAPRDAIPAGQRTDRDDSPSAGLQ